MATQEGEHNSPSFLDRRTLAVHNRSMRGVWKLGNIPMLRCEGQARAMGLAQGEAFREQIQDALRTVLQLEAIEGRRPRWMPHTLFRRMAPTKAAAFYGPLLEQHAPEINDRLHGIAVGARVRPAELLFLSFLEIILTEMVYSLGGCTCVAVSAERSALGEPMILKNFDYIKEAQPFSLLRLSLPGTGYSSLDVTTSPVPGSHEGMNQHGLTICYNYAFPVHAGKEGIPVSAVVQFALQSCKTTDEAVTFISQSRRAGGALLMIADAEGNCRLLELSTDRYGVREPEQGVLVATNLYRSPAMADLNPPENAVYPAARPVPKALWGGSCLDLHHLREARVNRLVRETTLLDISGAKQIMATHGSPGVRDAICRHADPGDETVAAMIFLPKSRRIFLSFERPCKHNYEEFHVERLLAAQRVEATLG